MADYIDKGDGDEFVILCVRNGVLVRSMVTEGAGNCILRLTGPAFFSGGQRAFGVPGTFYMMQEETVESRLSTDTVLSYIYRKEILGDRSLTHRLTV